MIGSIRFGQRPPKLFTRITEPNVPDGKAWEDPDGEWVPGQVKRKVPKGELKQILLSTTSGWAYLLPELGTRNLLKIGGLEGLRKYIEDAGVYRVFKEHVKRGFRDPYQNFWPVAVNGYWAHRHDAMHVEVSKLKPIRMGKAEAVNGIDGHSYKVVPLFHPDRPDFKAKYNGMLDEYRVAIHVFLKEPGIFNLLRLLHYTTRFIDLVPEPMKVIREHRATMVEAGIKPRL